MKTIIMASVCGLLTWVGSTYAQPAMVSNYYPLEIGHKWTYYVIDLKAAQPKVDPKKKVVVEVESSAPYVEPAKGKNPKKEYGGFILKSTSGGKITRDHVVVTENGVLRVHVAGMPMNPPMLFFKTAGIEPGMTWKANSVRGDTTLKGTSTAQIADIRIQNQAYRTYLISYRDDGIEIDYWFAHKIGMVRQRIKTENHEIVLELEK